MPLTLGYQWSMLGSNSDGSCIGQTQHQRSKGAVETHQGVQKPPYSSLGKRWAMLLPVYCATHPSGLLNQRTAQN